MLTCWNFLKWLCGLLLLIVLLGFLFYNWAKYSYLFDFHLKGLSIRWFDLLDYFPFSFSLWILHSLFSCIFIANTPPHTQLLLLGWHVFIFFFFYTVVLELISQRHSIIFMLLSSKWYCFNRLTKVIRAATILDFT